MSASADAPHRVYRFGVFEVDSRSGELRKRGVRRHLQGKPLQVLLALLERPGEVVTRDELQRRLWSPDVFVDFENGLNTAINRLRLTLGDSAEHPRYVETLARRLPIHRTRSRGGHRRRGTAGARAGHYSAARRSSAPGGAQRGARGDWRTVDVRPTTSSDRAHDRGRSRARRHLHRNGGCHT
jgi:hypothetical protein